CRPFTADEMYEEVRTATPYAALSRADFDDTLRFVENGGYSLAAYERWRRLFRDSLGRYHVAGDKVAQRYRMNVGTIVEAVMLKVRLVRGPVLGEIEEWFAQGLTPVDTFYFAGRLLRFLGIREMTVEAAPAPPGQPPRIP